MNRNNLTTAVIAGIAGVAGIANMASAVNLNPDGLGQVLLYPYYTVNAGQQTLLSVVNTTNVGKVVKVRFMEGYNSREVLDFNLYLSRFDVWTSTVFALSDAGVGPVGGFAGIFTTDHSCTDPALTLTGTFNNSGSGGSATQGYQQFLNFKYTGAANADTGPITDARTREGHFEMILMNDITIASALDVAITHAQPAGVPPNCTVTTLETAVGKVDPVLNPVTGVATTIADGGLFGSAAVVNVGQGAFFAYNADAIDGFTYVGLFTPPGLLTPTLGNVNDLAAVTATSRVFANGALFTSIYPSATVGSRTIDAVSSLFESENVYNEYVTSADGGAGTDWVLTFPTKRLYVDAQPGGLLPASTVNAFAPFEELFGEVNDGQSCVLVGSGTTIYNREEGHAGLTTCPISPCPPGQPQSQICLETNVLRFATASMLASGLPAQKITPFGSNGWVNLDLGTTGSGFSNGGIDGAGHTMYPATNGNTFHGLPVTGFEAARFTNGSVPLSGGGSALANYAGVFRHRSARDCTNGAGACS